MNILRKLLLSAIIFLPFQSIRPDMSFEEDELDFFDEDMIDHAAPKRSSFNKVDCYNFLTGVVGANDLLAEDFYNHTYFLNKRPINTYPNFLNYHNEQRCQDRTFNVFAFYNQTHKMHFTENSNAIKSYLLIGPDQGLIPALREDLIELLQEKGIDVPKTIGLFVGAKVEERRAGFMLQFLKTHKKLTFEVSAPIMYRERNYQFTDQEQKNIRDELGEGDKEEVGRMTRAHFVADRLGLGDTRIKVGYQISEKPKFCARLGAQVTLPTAFSFKKGLYGSHYRKKCLKRPKFDLCKIITAAVADGGKNAAEAAPLVEEFGLGAIDWISAILLDSPMGNNKHFSIGCFFEPSFQIAENVKIDSVISLDYIIPHKERRFFIQQKNKALFDDDNFPNPLDPDDPDDCAIAAPLLKFLNQQTLETFFPQQYKSFVSPGFMFQFTVGPKFTIRDWTFNIGYDFWYREGEKINPIFDKPMERLKLSQNSRCYQNKLFAAVKFNKIGVHRDWSISLNADETLSKSGIGRDFNVSLGLHVNF